MRKYFTQELERKAVFLTCLTIVMYTVPTLLKDKVILFPIPFYSLVFFVISLYSAKILVTQSRLASLFLVFSALSWLASEQYIWNILVGEIRSTSNEFQHLYLLTFILFLISLALFFTKILVQRKGYQAWIILPIYLILHGIGFYFSNDFFLLISITLSLVLEWIFTKKNIREHEFSHLPILGLLFFLQFTKVINILIMN